ncbi:MAG: hypothetical protein RL064_1277, partial [Bacteroidota bacterium]
ETEIEIPTETESINNGVQPTA